MKIIWQLIPALDIEEREDIIKYFNWKYMNEKLRGKWDHLYDKLSIDSYKKEGTIKALFLTDPKCEPLQEHLKLLSFPLSKTFKDYIVFVKKEDIFKIKRPIEEIDIANKNLQDLYSDEEEGVAYVKYQLKYKGMKVSARVIYILIDIEKRERDMTDDAYRRLAFVRGAQDKIPFDIIERIFQINI